VVDRIIRLPGVNRDTLIAGLSYKDYSVLDRLEQRGFRNIWRVALSELGLDVPGAGMESIQQVLTPAIGESLRASRGAPGVIVVRHLIEHSNSVGAVLQALQSWGDPAAHFVFEVPDSEDTFRKLDVSTLWEEHVSYFTEFTLRRTFVPHGLNLLEVVRYPYALEDCLVAFVMSSAPASLSAADPDSLDARSRWEPVFGTGWRILSVAVTENLKKFAKGEKPLPCSARDIEQPLSLIFCLWGTCCRASSTTTRARQASICLVISFLFFPLRI
jgi:hypothetical protein